MCEAAIDTIYDRCHQLGNKSLIDYPHLEKLNSCKVKSFVEAY